MTALFLAMLDTQTEKDRFAQLYDAYKDLLYWIAVQKTKNAQDAEECVQETFFYVANHFEKIGEVNSKRTKCFLATIVNGFAIDIYNNAKKLSFVSADDVLNDTAYFEDFEKAELLSVFDDVLDDESKIYFYLKYIYCYKSSEIAQLYNVKDSYIRKKLQYARNKLKKYLEGGK